MKKEGEEEGCAARGGDGGFPNRTVLFSSAVLTVRLLGGLAVDGPPTIVRVNDAVEVVFLVRGYPRQQNSGRRGSPVIGKCCVHVCPPLDYLLDYGNDGHSNNDRPLAVTPPRAAESPSRRTD